MRIVDTLLITLRQNLRTRSVLDKFWPVAPTARNITDFVTTQKEPLIMRDSQADLEKVSITLAQETDNDFIFLAGLKQHKIDTIAWLRERQAEDVKRVSDMYDVMCATLDKEIALVEKHMLTFKMGE